MMSDSDGGDLSDVDDFDDLDMIMQQVQSEQQREEEAERGCLEALIVCTGHGEIAQKHGMANLLEVIKTGVNNDLTILNNSPLFDDLLDDIALVALFEWSSKKMKEKTIDATDQITLLPDFIVHYILSFLLDDPKSCVRMSPNQTNGKHDFGYSSLENDSESVSPSCPSDRMQPSGRYNVVPPPITGNFMPSKLDLVFYIAPIPVKTDHLAFTVQLSPAKPTKDLSHTSRPSAPIIEEWVSDSEDDYETTASQIAHSSVQSTKQVTPHRHSVQLVEAPIPAITLKPTCLKTSCSGKKKNRKTCFVCRSRDHLIKDCKFHDKPETKPSPRNYAYMGFYKQRASFSNKYPQKHIEPATVLPKSKSISFTAVRPICADVPKIMMTRPRHAHSLNTRSNSTIRRHKTSSHSSNTSNSSLKVTVAKASVVSAAKGKKGKWVWRLKCPILDHDSRTTALTTGALAAVTFRDDLLVFEEWLQ
nr:F-box domain, leucine-rich repeat domain, L domain-like protein [Tanacetum cinerariifolium]